MRIYQHFTYTGREQRWVVPEGVTSATFECWGAAGGMPSALAWSGKVSQVMGGQGPANSFFYNNPNAETQLGSSYANNSGYVRGDRAVNAGETYTVNVGGNGGPGVSTVKLQRDGVTYTVGLRGGAGGWNGGGTGGTGALIKQNLYNSASNRVQYTGTTMPRAARAGQLWYDTSTHLVKKCNTTYTRGNGTAAKWDKQTHSHSRAVGPSGGGGGGATDIRFNGDDLTDRIMVAGGGGGAGGSWTKSGSAAWILRQAPTTPTPPFGPDTKATVNPTGPDHTWATTINYLVGGWGGGGIGGISGTDVAPSPTSDGGQATPGGSGGPATQMHKDGDVPGHVSGSGGGGGGIALGGPVGVGGNSTKGVLGVGGVGANAAGVWDDWCAGGGGGGGGYYGGGGGGQGFKVAGDNSAIGTRGGGGGGGSNYIASSFTRQILTGCARPPLGVGNYGTGANGAGGFARISYHVAPPIQWKVAPTTATASAAFNLTFSVPSANVAYYVVGSSATITDTFPTTQTTVMVTDPTLTDFTRSFTAPASGVANAFFVKAVDLDGDSSGWLKQIVTGAAASITTPATITAPAANAQFIDSTTVTWTVGTQTPLVAYRLGITGTDLVTGAAREDQTQWRRGGSRVNLATDPGFKTTAVWSSTANAALTSQTTNPGISGSSGRIAWNFTSAFDAEQHTTVFNNLTPGRTYRVHLSLASASTNDRRQIGVRVYDADGLLASLNVDMSTTAANTYQTIDLPFTPHTQGVYVRVVPSSLTALGSPLLTWDFEDDTTMGFTGGGATAMTPGILYQGDSVLRTSSNYATYDITSALTAAGGAGDYIIEGAVYSPVASVIDGSLIVSGTGVQDAGADPTATTTVRATWTRLRRSFHWDGTGTVTLKVTGDPAFHYWDDLTLSEADTAAGNADFGNTDSNQITYLANMLIELVYEEDKNGYGTYFDGTNLNGNTGTQSWSGTTNASSSYLTGTNVTSGVFSSPGLKLNNGSLYLDTVMNAAVNAGWAGARATVAVKANPSIPTTPTVTLQVNNVTGLMVLTINAADGAATNKTVSFDIFRNGSRIVTGLTPDPTTRQVSYSDDPGHGVASTYVVRAIDSAGGYTDQTDGTITVVS